MAKQDIKIDDLFKEISQLDELSEGDSDFDSEAIWQKVHEQLTPKHKRPVFWYWASAVAVSFMLIGFLVWEGSNFEKNNVVIQKNIPLQTTRKTSIQTQQTSIKEPIINDKSVSKKVENIIQPIKKEELTKEIVPENIQGKTAAINPLPIIPKFEPSVALNLEHTEIVPPILKKKMKIAHINELEESQPTTVIASQPRSYNSSFIILGSPSRMTTGEKDVSHVPLLTSSGILRKQ